MADISVLGATGYAGIELMRLLSAHPEVNIRHAVSRSFAGQGIGTVYPNFARSGIVFEEADTDKVAEDSDIVFTSLPHGLSQETVSALYEKGARVIDLSGDFRYDDAAVYEKWYGAPHANPALLKEKVYGIPELYREKIARTRLVGNPGCYTTCAILPLYPLLKDGLVAKKHIVVDAKSGVSGAGRSEKLAYAFSETDENFKAYGVATHRHTSEIEQELSKAAGEEIALSFTPHLLPVKRGILSTIYADLSGKVTRGDILKCYEMYKGEPFINVYAEGLPELKHVNGSNCVNIGFVIDERLQRLVVVSALDNLVKGAAGQAVQNMNLLLGFPETMGLNETAWYL
jgi:N-acetyl-gamma-glutamyl-phosphate reductase